MLAHRGAYTPVTLTRVAPVTGLVQPLVHVAMHHHQMSPEHALGACHAACVLHIRRSMLIPHLVDR